MVWYSALMNFWFQVLCTQSLLIWAFFVAVPDGDSTTGITGQYWVYIHVHPCEAMYRHVHRWYPMWTWVCRTGTHCPDDYVIVYSHVNTMSKLSTPHESTCNHTPATPNEPHTTTRLFTHQSHNIMAKDAVHMYLNSDTRIEVLDTNSAVPFWCVVPLPLNQFMPI